MPCPQLVEKVFSTSCLRFQNFQKVLKSIDLNGAGHPSWVHLRAKSRATPGCAPKRPAGQPRTPFLPVFLHFRVYRQPKGGAARPHLPHMRIRALIPAGSPGRLLPHEAAATPPPRSPGPPDRSCQTTCQWSEEQTPPVFPPASGCPPSPAAGTPP